MGVIECSSIHLISTILFAAVCDPKHSHTFKFLARCNQTGSFCSMSSMASGWSSELEMLQSSLKTCSITFMGIRPLLSTLGVTLAMSGRPKLIFLRLSRGERLGWLPPTNDGPCLLLSILGLMFFRLGLLPNAAGWGFLPPNSPDPGLKSRFIFHRKFYCLCLCYVKVINCVFKKFSSYFKVLCMISCIFKV